MTPDNHTDGIVNYGAGCNFTCALNSVHVVKCWGRDRDGILAVPSASFSAGAGTHPGSASAAATEAAAIPQLDSNADPESPPASPHAALALTTGTRHACLITRQS